MKNQFIYDDIYETMITGTMQYINIKELKRFKLDKTAMHEPDIIKASAIASHAPMTLVYTPSGAGKSDIVRARVNALLDNNVPAEKIAVLNMNIAKCKQMSAEFPAVNIMTFSDFTHGIFMANYPQCEQSDITSIVNTLRLQPPSAKLNDMIGKLSIANQQDKMTALALFTNANIQFVTDTIMSISKTDYALESMIVQNMLYYLPVNPYDFDEIIINGVQNMPISILCSILEYANISKCNLFMTGCPDETIYGFNMACQNTMNILSSYDGVDIIRINNADKISSDIKNFLNMNRSASIDNVQYMGITADYDTSLHDLIHNAMGLHTSYLVNKLNEKKPVLILARSKSDIAEIKSLLIEEYKPVYPGLNILDLSMIQYVQTCYGEIASKYYEKFVSRYPSGLTVGQFFFDLYNLMAYEQNSGGVPNTKTQLAVDKDNLFMFFNINRSKFPDNSTVLPVRDMIQSVIDIESNAVKEHAEYVKNNANIVTDGADIILSTIHTAIDIRNDDVIILMRNHNEKTIDDNVYRVAISRANKSEYIIFINYGHFETTYQKYLKTHTKH